MQSYSVVVTPFYLSYTQYFALRAGYCDKSEENPPLRRKPNGEVPKRTRNALLKVERSPKPLSKAIAETGSGLESSFSAARRRRVLNRY